MSSWTARFTLEAVEKTEMICFQLNAWILTVKQISALVQINLEIGTLDVKLKVLLHRIDVVEDVIDDPGKHKSEHLHSNGMFVNLGMIP